MTFELDDYTYVPPEIMEEFFKDDIDEDSSFEHSSKYGDFEWGPNGENSPEYNHAYWEANKDEILARRDELKAEREAEAREHGAYRDSNSKENYEKDLWDAMNELMTRDYGYQRRASNQNTKKTEEDKKEEEKKDDKDDKKTDSSSSSKASSSSSSSDDDDDSKKKSGSGSSGSSKKSSSSSGAIKQSSDFGKSKSSASVLPGTKAAKASSSSGSSGGSSKESSGSSKSSSSKEETSTKLKEMETERDKYKALYEQAAKQLASDASSSSSDSTSSTEKTYDSETQAKINEALTAVKNETYTGSITPNNNYVTFISALEKNGYTPEDTDEGLQLWKKFRSSKGYYTSDETLAKVKAEEEEKEEAKHSMDLFENVLSHHGILGMHWGVRNGPPYPLGYGDHNASEKKAGWENSLSETGRKALKATRAAAEKAGPVAEKVAKKTGAAAVKAGKATVAAVKNADTKYKAKKAAKKEAEEEEARRQYQEKRDNAIKTGDSQYARDHFAELSSQEVNELLSRLDLSKKVDKANHVMTAEEKIDDIMNKVKRASDWATTGTNAWNNVARIYNTMNGDDPIPIIGQDFNQTKRDIATRRQKEWYDSVSRVDPTKISKSDIANMDNKQLGELITRIKNEEAAEMARQGKSIQGKGGNNVSLDDIDERLEKKLKERGL